MWICQTPCCCSEMGWKVGDEWRLPPNPDNGGDAPPPPPPAATQRSKGTDASNSGMGTVGTGGDAITSKHRNVAGILARAGR